MYHVSLLKWNSVDNVDTVEPEVTVDTLGELHELVEKWIGFVPDWLLETSRDQYLQEEDYQGDLILDVEGAEVS